MKFKSVLTHRSNLHKTGLYMEIFFSAQGLVFFLFCFFSRRNKQTNKKEVYPYRQASLPVEVFHLIYSQVLHFLVMWKPERLHIAPKLWYRRKANSQKNHTVQLSSIQKIQFWHRTPCSVLPFFASDSCWFGWQGIIASDKFSTSVISDN